jgi:hypothetical protein
MDERIPEKKEASKITVLSSVVVTRLYITKQIAIAVETASLAAIDS